MDTISNLKKTLKHWEIQFYKEHNRKPKQEDIGAAPDNIKAAYSQYNKLRKEDKRRINSSDSKVADMNNEAHETLSTNNSTKGMNGDSSHDVGPDNGVTAEIQCKDWEREGKEVELENVSSDTNPDSHKIENNEDIPPLEPEVWGKQFDKKLSSCSAKVKPKSSNSKKNNTYLKGLSSKLFANSKQIGEKEVKEQAFVSRQWKQSIQQNVSMVTTSRDEEEESFACFSDEADDTDQMVFDHVSKETENKGMECSKLGMFRKAVSLSNRKAIQCSKLCCRSPTKLHLRVEIKKRNSHILRQSERRPRNGRERQVMPVPTHNVSVKKTTQKWTGETVTPDCVPMEVSDLKDVEDVPVISKQNRKRKKDKCEDGAQRKRKKAEVAENVSCTDVPPVDKVDLSGGEDDVKPSIAPKKQSAAGSRRKISQDNFVRLNMKVKTYKRKGGKGMTGPQHKRFMWKQKMAARSASRGDNCFKCGQSGHWANKCPGGSSKSGKMGSGDRHEEPVNEEDFPSLQEAAMMAKGIKVKRSEVKKEKNVKKTKEDKEEEDEEDEEEVQIEAGITRSAPEYMITPPPFSPLIEPGTQETPADVWKGLKMFGFDEFRRGQEQAIIRILSGQSTLVVLSTGGGKSLCYQLPAYLYAQRSKSITLVISPLVSLMEDQITGLPAGLHGACLHTNMTPAQREGVLASVKDGRVHFLLVSPEAVAGGSMTLLNSRANLPPISFVCIDEAHCLSEWSHNFRPAYLRLCKVLRDKFGVHCFLGLTATATQSTAADVAKHIGIEDCDEAIIRGPPVPRNLFLSVSRDEDRDQSLIGMLQGKRFSDCESIIIYCTRREQTERLATLIRTCLKEEKSQEWEDGLSKKKGGRKKYAFWDAESYHAGLTPAQRKRVQNAFMSGRLRVVVATVAFGMGLDKSNVRGVIHYNLPKSFESYVQEIGRAGRDGRDSHCHLFLDSEGKDLCELRRHTYANTVDYRTLKRFIQHIFVPCHCKAVQKLQQQAQREKEEFEQAAKIFATDWDEEDEQTQGEETRKQTPGGDTDKPTPGGDTGVQTPGGDTDVQTLGRDTGVPTPGGDTGVPTPGGDTDIPTPGGDTDVPTPGGDTGVSTKPRLCLGHERAMPIEDTVTSMDVKEEGLCTLMCYLENHSQMWLSSMSNIYVNCHIQCYGGPSQLQKLAKKCPPIAVAIAKAKKSGKTFSDTNSLSFSVVEVSDCMGWASGPVKQELKTLAWDFNQPGSTGPVRSGVLVEFSDLAFHFRSPGDLEDEEMDDVLQFLHDRVQTQEKTELQQLKYLHNTLRSVSHKNYWMCSDEFDKRKDEKLKVVIVDYFQEQTLLKKAQQEADDTPEVPQYELGQLVSDIRQFVNVYGTEHKLNGRAIARVFHGIGSPCFPANVWGRNRRYWRAYMNIDFNLVVKTATKELISMR
ncbi:ATP-dependent DNA helicase Q4-like [Pecten maximus]|uniref:ATP-dependent DNA helicase Q4-like n=1 Tax=Pecten maximus TaxID=6579 RepID=UPI0014587B21|nr:ATP-dependent DNA helicase Q4-like [Pecten maximus]